MARFHTHIGDPTVVVHLMAPSHAEPHTVRVQLEHVRAADEITIRYDLARDGWRIGMNRTREIPGEMVILVEDEEVAFVPAWNEGDSPEAGVLLSLVRARLGLEETSAEALLSRIDELVARAP